MRNWSERSLIIVPVLSGSISYLAMGMPPLLDLKPLLILSVAVLGSIWIYGLSAIWMTRRDQR